MGLGLARDVKRLKRDHEGSTAHDSVVSVSAAGDDDVNVLADESVSLSSSSSVPSFSNQNDSSIASDSSACKRKAATGTESE